MPNHKSAIKRVRQNERRRVRNMSIRTRARSAVKQVRAAIASGDREAAEKALHSAVSVLDGSVSRGIHHPNNAARRVSRLTRQVNRMS